MVVADETLRRKIRAEYPDCYSRIELRRAFMSDELGFELTDEGRQAVAEEDALRLTNNGELNV